MSRTGSERLRGQAIVGHEDLAMIRFDDAPPVLLIADSAHAVARARAAAATAGVRIAATVGLADANARLEQHSSLVVIDVEADEGSTLDLVLDRIDAEVRDERRRAIIVAAPPLIDIVAARVAHPGVAILVEPDADDYASMLAQQASPLPVRLHDVNKGGQRLQQLSEEVGRIASILATLSEDEPGEADRESPEIPASAVRALIRRRRLREQYFDAELFADPAWDMMLDLFAARRERRPVAVSSLCIAASVPPTTALRWIKRLTDLGLFVRIADPHDGRRVFIDLSDEATISLETYFRHAQRVSPIGS